MAHSRLWFVRMARLFNHYYYHHYLTLEGSLTSHIYDIAGFSVAVPWVCGEQSHKLVEQHGGSQMIDGLRFKQFNRMHLGWLQTPRVPRWVILALLVWV